MRSILFSVCVLYGTLAIASPYDPMIDYAARKHGVDPILLRAITAQESKKNPWTFNADGEPFQYQDKETAVRVLWSLTKAPWMTKLVTQDKQIIRRFFSNQSAAQSWANSMQRLQIGGRSYSLTQRIDDSKDVKKGEIRVRHLRLINTDIGIAQINYRWNGQGIATVQQWFDPRFNLDYAATRLGTLKKKHGSDLAAAGYYHSKTEKYRKKYLSDLLPRYNEEKRNASVSVAIGN